MNSLDIASLEAKAKENKKSISCEATLIFFLPCLGLGIYYWFVNDIVFNYDIVSPFSGFFLFFTFGSTLTILVSYMYSQYWKSYNSEIDKANKEISKLLKSGILSDDDFFRLKKDYIERRIKNGKKLGPEEFDWHTSHVCWCCGKAYSDKGASYIYEKSRTVSWKDGAIRKSRTYKKTARIQICTDCYVKLTKRDSQNKKNGNLIMIVDTVIMIILSICFIIYFYTEMEVDVESAIGMTFICIAALGLIWSIGQIIVYPLACLISYPFAEKSAEAIVPKWNFDNIPEIKKFLEMKLPLE